MSSLERGSAQLASPRVSTHSSVPRVVGLGGGYGLSTALRAMRGYAGDIVGVASVADDGGSSGRLRRAFGIPAPGDLRRCLVALAAPGNPWAEAFEHRFTTSELEGHPLGNLVLAGLTEHRGDFQGSIDLALRLLGAVGQVHPATVEPVELKATFRGPGERRTRTVTGEANVGATAGVDGVSHVPSDPAVPAPVLAAIERAHQIVIGPGSLYTSVLAVCAIPAIREALETTRATRVYVANLQEQHPETQGYDVAAHLDALERHGTPIDVVLHDPSTLALGSVTPTRSRAVVAATLAGANSRFHDPSLLAAELAKHVRRRR